MERTAMKSLRKISEQAPASLVRQLVDAPRDIKQCKNSLQNQRDARRISRYSICELSELYYETDFISDLILFPTFTCLCFHQSKYDYYILTKIFK
jgi:hypothetical protein